MTIVDMKEKYIGTDKTINYSHPELRGVFKTDWAFYDDGVRIDNGWTENSDNTFSRNIRMYGKLTARTI